MEDGMKIAKWVLLSAAISSAVLLADAKADSVTGNPFADGWTAGGHSLAQGTYVRGSANYAYQTYSAVLTVTPGSNLEISDGANSWLVGDTVLGLGGVFDFDGITAADAGWTDFSGVGVNSLLPNYTANPNRLGPKLQAKFGTEDSTFSASTVAPGAGNGAGSGGSDGKVGMLQIRTSAYLGQADWSGGAGAVQNLASAGHIDRVGGTTPIPEVARLMWTWDETLKAVVGWEILLNTSLLERLYPDYAGPIPTAGSLSLLTVQDNDNAYTDALVQFQAAPVPLPAAAWGGMALIGLMGVNRLRCRKSDRA
jgi:hypothetical protein